jgi:hypothetical protein
MEEKKIDDKELINIISKETEPLFKEQFVNGVITGWNACLLTIKKEISGMTSCRKIKKYIDKKIEDSNNRKEKEGDKNN